MTAFSKNTYSFPLDIKRRTGVKLLGVNGDTANRFIVTLQDAGVNLDLTGLYVRAVFRRSDGVTVLQSESDSPANITKTTGGVVTINVLNGSFRDGDNEMEIQVLDGDPDTGDVLITSARMLFRVRKELNSDDATESSHEYTVLQQFIDGLGNMTVTVETLAAGSSATAGLTIGDDYSYELTLGIPRGADGSDGLNGVGIANIQALESIIDGSYSLKVTMTDSTIYTFPLPFYIKPAGGIPKSDLAAGVQASLGKADSALQEHQSLAGYATQTWVGQQGYLTEHQDLSAYRTASDQDAIDDAQDVAIATKYTKPSGGIPTDDIADFAITHAKLAANAVEAGNIKSGEITNAKLTAMPAGTIKGNSGNSAASPSNLTGTQVTAMLDAMVAPSSSRVGRKGLVPAPDIGGGTKFLRGDGTWVTPPVASVNGQTGAVALTAEDFDIYRVVYTVDLDTSAVTCNKTAYEIFTAMQSGKAVEAALVDADSNYTIGHLSSVLFGGTTLIWSAQSYSSNIELYILYHTIANNAASFMVVDIPADLVTSVNGQTGDITLTAEDVDAQTPFHTATLTIAVSDWNNGSCTKTVTGMTADALVWVEFSDTETEYETTQATNALTFTADTAPSEAVTVKVGWFE